MEFNEKLIQARKAKAMSQEALAEAVGVSRQAVSKWETGEAKPDMEKLAAVCGALELSMDYLCLDRVPEPADEHPEPVKTSGLHGKSLLLGIFIGLVVGLLAGALAVGLLWKPASGGADEAGLLQSIRVAGADVEGVTEAAGKMLQISVMPSVQVDGLEVKIMVKDCFSGDVRYLTAEKNGGVYSALYPRGQKYDLQFSAVFVLGETRAQARLFDLEGDETSWTQTSYWGQ